MAVVGYVNELLGDDRVWDSGAVETTLTGWPLEYEQANLAIFNNTTDKVVKVRTLNIRPYSGPQNTAPYIQLDRISALDGGDDVEVTSFDSENAALPSQVIVKYHPSTATVTSNTTMRRIPSYTGMNIDRAMQRMCSYMAGAKDYADQTQMALWWDSGCQKMTLREGEGLLINFTRDSGPNVFAVSFYFRDQSTGATYYANQLIEPLFMAGAPVLGILNGAGSGVILEVFRIQVRESGDDQQPWTDWQLIEAIDGAARDAQVVWSDSEAIPTNILFKKNVAVRRSGYKCGAIITSPRMRRVMCGEPPYGPGIGSAVLVTRRGLFCHDMRYINPDTMLKLGPGKGVAIISKNPSSCMYAEMVGNVIVEDLSASAVYPIEDNVRDAITYGPTGADFTGNVVLPSEDDVRNGISYDAHGTDATGNMALPGVNDVRVGVSFGTNSTEATGTIALPAVGDVKLGVSYGANGTEATGTLAGGGGGGRHIVISGGWN